MPKIVINEYDKTKAGLGAYANFSVVVPGFLGQFDEQAGVTARDVEDKFDENGIYECDSRTDFEKFVGKQSYTLETEKAVLAATAPVITATLKFDQNVVLSSALGRTDGETYLITEPKTGEFLVSYKNQSLFTEALNAWYTHSVNLPTDINNLQETVQYLVDHSATYTPPVEEDVLTFGTVTFDDPTLQEAYEALTAQTEPQSDPEVSENPDELEELTTQLLLVQVIRQESQDELPVSDAAIELGYFEVSNDKVTSFTALEGFEMLSLGSCSYGEDKTISGCVTHTIANLDTTKLGFRIKDANGLWDSNKIYTFTNDGTFNPYVKATAVRQEVEEDKYELTNTNYFLYIAQANPDADDIGYLKDASCIYTKAASSGRKNLAAAETRLESGLQDGSTVVFKEEHIFEQSSTYYIIGGGNEAAGVSSLDNRGTDGNIITENVMHYGNQIAYELLGLGYTVLFKRLVPVSLKEMIAKTPVDGKVYATAEEFYAANKTAGETAWNAYKEAQKQNFIAEYCDAVTTDKGIVYNLKPEHCSLSILEDSSWWECLKDKSTYDFRYVVTGLMDNNAAANQEILNLAHHISNDFNSGRGDCIALIDIDRNTYTGVDRNTQSAAIPYIAREASKFASKYAAVFAPTVTYVMVEDPAYGNNRTFPGSFHYLACAAKSAENYSEWYANAGYTRGVCNYTIESTGCKLGEVAVQALEPRHITALNPIPDEDDATQSVGVNTTVAVNLIIKVKNSYYLWGNRTAHNLGAPEGSDGDLVASHFLNIRQLCTTIKKQVYVACRRFTFDPNSNVLWINFCNAIRPTLEKMKADQGIKDYAIVAEKTAQKAVLAAKIRIVPIEAVEDFYINLFLEDSISGDAQVSESE